jgi:NAD(P)-dependent dehydrogenase (short-subunit alcohol dehydrogenase family)
MARELEGKRALVTGSSSGIGEAIAERLAREGARLVVHGRNVERAERVAAKIRAIGAEAHVAIGDLMRDDQAMAVADTADAALGGIDILVNNAGGQSSGGGQATFFESKPEEWLATYNGNVVGAIRLIQRFAPGMKAAGWGRIIQISSLVSHRPNLVIPDYAAAKAGLNNMTVGLSLALAGTGVTVNSISPGVILTAGVEAWFRKLSEQFGWGTDWAEIEKRAIAALAPNHVGRAGRPEDVAHAVMYLASPQGGFVTGTDMLVSGGPA